MPSSVLPCLRNFHPTTKPPSSMRPVSIVGAAFRGLFSLPCDTLCQTLTLSRLSLSLSLSLSVSVSLSLPRFLPLAFSPLYLLLSFVAVTRIVYLTSSNPLRCAFTPSALSFLPFRFPIYPFRWLTLPLFLSLPLSRSFLTSEILNRSPLPLIQRPGTQCSAES